MITNLIGFNIVLKNNTIDPSDPGLELDKIRRILMQQYSSNKPVITHFPEMYVIFFPVEQVTFVIQQKTVILTDNSGKSSEEQIEAISSLIIKIINLLPNKTTAFGYNYITECEFEKKDNGMFLNLINADSIKTLGLSKGTILPSPIKITSQEKKGSSITISIIPRLSVGEKKDKYFHFEYNYHFDKSRLPSINKMVEDISSLKKEKELLLDNFDK